VVLLTHIPGAPIVVSVEARAETMTEVWPQWQSEGITGVYPLRRFLSGSGHSAYSLLECRHRTSYSRDQAHPGERALTEAQLSHLG